MYLPTRQYITLGDIKNENSHWTGSIFNSWPLDEVRTANRMYKVYTFIEEVLGVHQEVQ